MHIYPLTKEPKIGKILVGKNVTAMLKNKTNKILFLLILTMALLSPSNLGVYADTMSSTNYRIQADSLNAGGNRSTSGSFILEDTLGEFSTGEDLSSASYQGCSGYECFVATPFLTFSVKQGTSAPGTTAAGVYLGAIPLSSVITSNGSSVNSIFITTETNATSGVSITVKDANSGLARASAPAQKIDSASATLVAGTAGYGFCVYTTSVGSESPATLSKASPYNGTCNYTTGHVVGLLDDTNRQILSSTGSVKTGQAEILVKAAAGSTTQAGSDYQDTATFIATGTY